MNYTYGDSNHDHAVTSLTSGESYVYDANGNQTQRNNVGGGNYTLGYDTENRLVSGIGLYNHVRVWSAGLMGERRSVLPADRTKRAYKTNPNP